MTSDMRRMIKFAQAASGCGLTAADHAARGDEVAAYVSARRAWRWALWALCEVDSIEAKR